jgi:hypothetical protein
MTNPCRSLMMNPSAVRCGVRCGVGRCVASASVSLLFREREVRVVLGDPARILGDPEMPFRGNPGRPRSSPFTSGYSWTTPLRRSRKASTTSAGRLDLEPSAPHPHRDLFAVPSWKVQWRATYANDIDDDFASSSKKRAMQSSMAFVTVDSGLSQMHSTNSCFGVSAARGSLALAPLLPRDAAVVSTGREFGLGDSSKVARASFMRCASSAVIRPCSKASSGVL